MHGWKDTLDVLEGVGMPDALGFQADLAHLPLHPWLQRPRARARAGKLRRRGFWPANDRRTPPVDHRLSSQNDGEVHGAGSHDKTGKHCPADDPNGKLDITRCAGYWLKDTADRGIEHICWDGCMFPNATLENADTWNTILKAMIDVRDSHGQN